MSAASGFWKPAPARLQNVVRDEESRGGEYGSVGVVPPAARNVSIARQRMLLPIYKHKRQIIYSMENYGCLIIVGETGKYYVTEYQVLVETARYTSIPEILLSPFFEAQEVENQLRFLNTFMMLGGRNMDFKLFALNQDD